MPSPAGVETRSRRRSVCEHALVRWQQIVLSLVVYEVFLLGTQWLFLDGISTIATIVFTAFFLVLMRPWRLKRPEPSGSSISNVRNHRDSQVDALSHRGPIAKSTHSPS